MKPLNQTTQHARTLAASQEDELPGGSGALGALPALLLVLGLIGGGVLYARAQARKQSGKDDSCGRRTGPGKRRMGGPGARSDERAPLTPAPRAQGDGAAADAEFDDRDHGDWRPDRRDHGEWRPEVMWASELRSAGEEGAALAGGTELPSRKVVTPIQVVGGGSSMYKV